MSGTIEQNRQIINLVAEALNENQSISSFLDFFFHSKRFGDVLAKANSYLDFISQQCNWPFFMVSYIILIHFRYPIISKRVKWVKQAEESGSSVGQARLVQYLSIRVLFHSLAHSLGTYPFPLRYLLLWEFLHRATFTIEWAQKLYKNLILEINDFENIRIWKWYNSHWSFLFRLSAT